MFAGGVIYFPSGCKYNHKILFSKLKKAIIDLIFRKTAGFHSFYVCCLACAPSCNIDTKILKSIAIPIYIFARNISQYFGTMCKNKSACIIFIAA